VRLGIAVDVQRKDGSRMLLVPNIKDAAAELRGIPESLRRAGPSLAAGTDLADDFIGTTVSLTNPDLGTTQSAPRLMAAGADPRHRALDYPAEYRSMARDAVPAGISKS